MNSNYTNAENILSCRTSEYTSDEDSSKNEVKDIASNEETQHQEPEAIEEEKLSVSEEYIEVKSEIKMTEDEESSEDYGTFEGYASVFENTDLGNDVIKTGAFTKSIKERTHKGIKLLYQHKSDMPIGVFDEIKEDSHGLHVKGRLALKTAAGRDAYELLKMGALDAMSIGFRANPEEISYDKRSQKRTIGEVDLLEISLVTFPMNPQAVVRSVKADEITIREWENGLRDAFTLSRSEAKVAAKAVYQTFEEKANSEMLIEPDHSVELVEAIKNLTLTLKTSN